MDSESEVGLDSLNAAVLIKFGFLGKTGSDLISN